MRRHATLLVMTLACGAPSPEPPQVFVAFAEDFQPYTSWTSFYVGDVPSPTGVDIAGPRTVYINEMPPAGATQFPVGTILVKVVKPDPSPQDWQVFGMVKRGGDYDLQGAPNWEWFGLSIDPTTSRVLINWRGTGPPPDGGYGSIGACIFCHANSYMNDYVQTPELQLSKL